ncbi:DUF1648 domain-containing protein [Macrococcus brunensis]|nr:DUF1648 domain-containing protein [Macrococcus brunensis]
MEIIILSLMVLAIGLMMLFSGRWTKRNLLFSIYVPDEQQDRSEVKAIQLKFRNRTLLASVVATLLTGFMLATLSDGWGMAAFIIIIHTLIIVELFIYSQSYRSLKHLKEQEDWMKGKQMVRATDTAIRNDVHVLPAIVYLIPSGLLLLATLYTLFNYPEIPERVAVHWGMDNKPDRFEEKSLMTVFMPAGMGFFTLLIMMAISNATDMMPLKLNPAARKASAAYEGRTRKNNSYVIFMSSMIMALLFSFIMVQQIMMPNEDLPAAFMPVVLIGTFLPVIAGMYLQWKADKDYRHAAAENDKAPYHDDSNYVLGLFYYNKQDPNVWVPKVSQFGMTLNMARTEAKILAILFILVILGPLLLIEFLSK